jgi:hypothetical protein
MITKVLALTWLVPHALALPTDGRSPTAVPDAVDDPNADITFMSVVDCDKCDTRWWSCYETNRPITTNPTKANQGDEDAACAHERSCDDQVCRSPDTEVSPNDSIASMRFTYYRFLVLRHQLSPLHRPLCRQPP